MRDLETWVLLQDPPLQLAQLAPGVEPELLSQPRGECREQLEPLDLTPAAVQREHRLRRHTLAQRLIGAQPAQLRQQLGLVAERQLRVDLFLARDQAQLLQPLCLSARKVLVGKLAKRRAAPQTKRAPEQRDGQRMVAVTPSSAPVIEQLFKARCVERAIVQLEGIARCARADRERWCEQLAQLRHVHLQQVPRRRRRHGAPHGVDQNIGRDRFAAADRQYRQQPPLLGRAERHGALSADELNWPQNPNLHDRPTRVTMRAPLLVVALCALSTATSFAQPDQQAAARKTMPVRAALANPTHGPTLKLDAQLMVASTTEHCLGAVCTINNHGNGQMTHFGKVAFTTVITADGNQPPCGASSQWVNRIVRTIHTKKGDLVLDEAGLQCPQPGVGPRVDAVWAVDGADSTGLFAGASGRGSDLAYPTRNTATPRGTITLAS